jgi:hypothetical protein
VRPLRAFGSKGKHLGSERGKYARRVHHRPDSPVAGREPVHRVEVRPHRAERLTVVMAPLAFHHAGMTNAQTEQEPLRVGLG